MYLLTSLYDLLQYLKNKTVILYFSNLPVSVHSLGQSSPFSTLSVSSRGGVVSCTVGGATYRQSTVPAMMLVKHTDFWNYRQCSTRNAAGDDSSSQWFWYLYFSGPSKTMVGETLQSKGQTFSLFQCSPETKGVINFKIHNILGRVVRKMLALAHAASYKLLLLMATQI